MKNKTLQDQFGNCVEIEHYSDHERTDYLWAAVADEADADSFVKVERLARLREPYISCDGEGWQAAHEWMKE